MKKYKKIFVENSMLLLINFGVLCFLCGSILREYREMDMGVWGYVLSTLSNHYYILYCVFPILLIITARHIRNASDIERIRYRNSFQQIKMSTKSFIEWLALYMLAHLLVAFVIGIRTFGLSVHLKNIETAGYDELVLILNMYSKYFHNLVFAVLANVGYFLFGFAMLVALLSYVNYKYKYRNMLILSVFIYIFTFIGFKTDLKMIVPIICFDNFILLHHGLFVNGTAKFLLTVLFAVLVIQFCFGKRFKFDDYGLEHFIISKKEKILSCIIVFILFLLELFRTIGDQDFNFKDVIITGLFGTNENYVSFVPWLRLTILYLTPLFFIGVSDSRMKKYGQAPILIRFKNKLEFECKLINEYIKYICLYTGFVYVIGNVLYFLGNFGTHDEMYLIRAFNVHFTYGILNMYFVIFLVNLMFDFFIFKIIAEFTHAIASVLVVLFCKFIFFMVPIANIFDLNFGMVNLFDGLKNKYELGIKIFTVAIVSVIYFIVINTRRLKHGNHQN